MKSITQKIFSKKVFYAAGAFAGTAIVIAILFDLFIMPHYTNYNKGITVPDVTKLSLEDAEFLLERYGLRHEVHERRANSVYPANYIIDQAPAPNQIVKPNRKVYLTVNTAVTPQTVVPDVVNMSLRNAEIQLENHGLVVGTRSYESSRFRNTILRQSVAAGDTVSRGTVVNLAVSDGLGSRMVNVPDVEGMRLSEAQQTIIRAGLRVGEIRFQPSRDQAPNTIIDYSPREEQLTEGQSIMLIVSERFDAREEVEEGAIIDDTTSVNQPPPNENEQ